MKCENCQNKATVHFTQLVDGIVKKKSFCDACAAEQGVTDLSGFGLGEGLVGGESGATTESVSQVDGVCGVCGFSLQKFQQVGRMGCSECYQSFLDEVSGRLPAMHRGMFHIGRTPAGAYIGSMRAKRLEEMEKSLKALVDSEDYEKAAKLRDEMKKLAGGEVEV